MEPREPQITIVTRGGVVMGEDQEAMYGQLLVQPKAQTKAPFNAPNEKEVFLDAR